MTLRKCGGKVVGGDGLAIFRKVVSLMGAPLGHAFHVVAVVCAWRSHNHIQGLIVHAVVHVCVCV